MPDLTPEERADRIATTWRIGDSGEAAICNAIREAVAAKDAEIAELWQHLATVKAQALRDVAGHAHHTIYIGPLGEQPKPVRCVLVSDLLAYADHVEQGIAPPAPPAPA